MTALLLAWACRFAAIQGDPPHRARLDAATVETIAARERAAPSGLDEFEGGISSLGFALVVAYGVCFLIGVLFVGFGESMLGGSRWRVWGS